MGKPNFNDVCSCGGCDVAYCIHLCKNSRLKETDPNYCESVFIEEDRENVQDYPSTQLYCPECVKKGFKNPRRMKKLTEEQKREIGQRLKAAREKKNAI